MDREDIMSKHNDATGYLLAYRDTVNEAWFHAICDNAIQSVGGDLLPEQLEKIWGYFQGYETFTPTASATSPLTLPPGTAQIPFYLERLSGFKDFKRLSPSLTLNLSRRVTLIFGKNGAGKSSLCQALKILSNPEKPKDPFNNVRSKVKTLPSFSYKFRNSSQEESWSELDGFGSQAQALKYFDSTIALKNATGSINPESVVEISVFRLECFEHTRNYVKQFQVFALEKIKNNRKMIDLTILEIKTKVSSQIDVNTGVFASWQAQNTQPMLDWLLSIPQHDSKREEQSNQQQATLNLLVSASSAEGRKTLEAQQSLLSQLSTTLKTFNNACSTYSPSHYLTICNAIQQKEAAGIELAGAAFPKGTDPESHRNLIFSANSTHRLDTATSCPLCLQSLSEQAKALFTSYHNYLILDMQAELIKLKENQKKQIDNYQNTRTLQKPDLQIYKTLFNSDFLDQLDILLTNVLGAISSKTLTTEVITHYNSHSQLISYIIQIDEKHTQTISAIQLANSDIVKTQAQITQLKEQISTTMISKAADSARKEIVDICTMAQQLDKNSSGIQGYNFTARLTALTTKMKEAHSELILSSFIPHLDAEYKKLCGSSLEQMGVKLANQGADAIVIPKIGDSPAHRVLSEGEQKVHALAVFMCEATASPHQILVLDDPVTSFDYNYVSNFCERLRDYVRAHTNSQLIILTHNWDFFANLQSVFNRSGLEHSLSIQIIEDCATIAEYAEKWDELCTQIDVFATLSTEPTSSEKEHVSGLMRRLIERLTNCYVFNEQRHQYKVKSLNISTFHHFVRLVPLLPQEADKLRDLYSNLSPPEHDDIRNFYSNKSLNQFVTWYNEIKAIKQALESRRPT